MSGATLDLETLPFPVAYPLSYARDESLGTSDRVDNVFFAGYQAVRTTALLLLADYLESSEICPRVSEAIRGLRLPHWKEWVDLATTLAKFWRGDYEQKSERESHFPSLVAAWLETAYPRRPQADGDWPTILKGLPGGHGPAKGPIDALWYARNNRTHGTGTRTGDPKRDAALLGRLLPLLEALTAELFPPEAFTLLRRVSRGDEEDHRVIRLHGPHRDRRFETEELGGEWASAFETTGVAALAGGEAVVIHPLFLPPDPDLPGGPVEGGGLLEDLYLVDRVSERKVVALGVLDERRLSESLIADVTAALKRKQVELGLDRDATRRWNLVDWSASTAGRLLADLTNRKYFPDFYYERADVDATLRRTLELEGTPETSPASALEPTLARGRALLLLGEAGSGKSSLLCRLVDGLLKKHLEEDTETGEKPTRRKKPARGGGSADLSRYLEGRGGGDVVLYLSGAAAYGGDAGKGADALLCDAVVRQGGVLTGAFPTLEHFVTKLDESSQKTGPNADHNPDRKVWIVLDGLNEADRFKDLVGALDRFLPHVPQRPWLRLVVSIRSGAYHELERKDRDAMVHEGAVFRNASCWASFPGERPDAFGRKQDVPYLEVRPFTAGREGQEAYRLRQAWSGGGSSEIRYEDLPQGVKTLLLSPLHLHLFHETWAGQARVPANLDEMGLFEAFLTRLTKEHSGLEERLQVLAEVMLERREALLPIEVAEKWEEEAGRSAGTMAARLAKLTPVEELVAASILMRPMEEGQGSQRKLIGYRFSHQSLASAVLARHLRMRLAGRAVPLAKELLVWAREASGKGEAGQGPFAELVDAVTTYVVACTRAADGEAVATMLDLETEEIRNELVTAGLVAFGPLRGALEEPDAVAMQFWGSFTQSAQTGGRAVRFDDAAWKAQRSNARTGFSRAAMDIGAFRTALLRDAVGTEPGLLGWKRDLAVSLNSLSRLQERAGRGAEAVALAEESLALMRGLVAAEPDRLDWKNGLSATLIRLSRLRERAGRVAEAEAFAEEDLALSRELVAADPGRLNWKNGLAATLNRLSSLREQAGRVAEAEAFAEEDLALSRELVAADPGRLNWKNGLAATLNRVSSLRERAGRGAEAEALVEEGLALRRELVASDPGRLDWKNGLAATLNRVSSLRERAGRGAAAEALVQEGLALRRELAAADPGRLDWKRDLTVSLCRLSDLKANLGRRAEADELAVEDVALSRELVATDPDRLDWKEGLAVSLNRTSGFRATTGDSGGAETLADEDVALSRELVAADPGRLDWKEGLTVSLSRLSDLKASAGRRAEAEALTEEDIALSRELVAADPERRDWRRDLTVSLNRLIDLRLLSAGHLVPLATAEESLALRRGLWEEEPDEPAAIYALVVGLDTIARVRIELGEVNLAQECIDEAESLWHRLSATCREAPHKRLEEARMLALRASLEPRNPNVAGWLEEAQRIVEAHSHRGTVAFKVLCVGRDIRNAEEAARAATGIGRLSRCSRGLRGESGTRPSSPRDES